MSSRRERRERHAAFMRAEGATISKNAGVKEALEGVDNTFGIKSMLGFFANMNGLFAFGLMRVMPKMDQSKLTYLLKSLPRNKEMILQAVSTFRGLIIMMLFIGITFLDFVWKPEHGDVFVPDGTLHMICALCMLLWSMTRFQSAYLFWRQAKKLTRKGLIRPLYPFFRRLKRASWTQKNVVDLDWWKALINPPAVAEEVKKAQETRRGRRKSKREAATAAAAAAAAAEAKKKEVELQTSTDRQGFYYYNTSAFSLQDANAGAIVGMQWVYFLVHYLMVYPFSAFPMAQMTTLLALQLSFLVMWVYRDSRHMFQHHVWSVCTLAIEATIMNNHLPNVSANALHVVASLSVVWISYVLSTAKQAPASVPTLPSVPAATTAPVVATTTTCVVTSVPETTTEPAAATVVETHADTPTAAVESLIVKSAPTTDGAVATEPVPEPSEMTFAVGQILEYEGSKYTCIVAHAYDPSIPPTNTTHWSLVLPTETAPASAPTDATPVLPADTPVSEEDKQKQQEEEKESEKYSIYRFPWWIESTPIYVVVAYVVLHLFITFTWTRHALPLPLAFLMLFGLPPLQLFFFSARAKVLLWKWYLFACACALHWVALLLLSRGYRKLRFEPWAKTLTCAIFYALISMAFGFLGFTFPIASLVREKLKLCLKPEFKNHNLFSAIDTTKKNKNKDVLKQDGDVAGEDDGSDSDDYDSDSDDE